MSKKLYRNTKDKLIFGVCSGIAEYVGIDPVIVRIAFIFLGGTLLIYLLLAVLMPVKKCDTKYKEYDYEKES